MKRTLRALLFMGGLALVWHFAAASGLWPPVLLPPPGAVIGYVGEAFRDGSLLAAAGVTARRLLLGYAAGVALGLPLGLMVARYRFLEDTIGLLALGLQTLPSVCWVPLAILWFGQTETAMLFVVVMGTIWSILLATDHGIRSVPPVYARAATTMGSRRFHLMLHVTIPAALPVIVGGMKQGWAFAWRSLMAAEIYVTIITGFGLGHLLHYGRELHAMDQVLGVMLVIVTVGLVMDKLLFARAETFLRRRWGLGG